MPKSGRPPELLLPAPSVAAGASELLLSPKPCPGPATKVGIPPPALLFRPGVRRGDSLPLAAPLLGVLAGGATAVFSPAPGKAPAGASVGAAPGALPFAPPPKSSGSMLRSLPIVSIRASLPAPGAAVGAALGIRPPRPPPGASVAEGGPAMAVGMRPPKPAPGVSVLGPLSS